ncbi:hypothetical protein PVAND_003094 [Polypedilum vanderplanki]|uniref:WD repeat-containing protein on Y chromosome n=1 Tax=Polypedilum vanderplanki TaxID=319348 RepID=A0A9J6BTH8_POLVA|nr:hypothetical protein PVAND_003094 [Polypedilum vanderplanki]
MASEKEEASNLIPKLYEILSVSDINNIRKKLKELQNDGLSYEEFRKLLLKKGGKYSDNDFDNLCLKIDLDRDNRIKFHEFITYYIAEFQHDDNAAEKFSIIPPIAESAIVLSSQVENNIIRIFHIPPSNVKNESSLSNSYMTVGSLGDVYIWSLKWKLQRVIHFDTLLDSESSIIEQFDTDSIKKDPKMLIVDAVLLQNLNFVCIASSCRDLCFYDISSIGHGSLKLFINRFPFALSSFCYHSYHDDKGEFSGRLIFGDFVGSIRVIDFTKHFAAQLRHGSVIQQISYTDLIERKFETMHCREFLKLHNDMIRQVAYFERRKNMITASENVLTDSAYLPGVIITHLGTEKFQIVFRMFQGTTCFVFDESSRTLATGGPDCLLRLWNPKNSDEPKTILSGHTAGIMNIFIQDGTRIYSIDKLNLVKVWDMEDNTLLQTYSELQTIFPKDIEMITFYDDRKQQLIAAAMDIAIIKCNTRTQADQSDGITHTTPVTLILLNELFHFLVSCGSDSTIIVWDIWKGRKVNWILEAHTAIKLGKRYPIEVCAGCFDTKQQYLLTGGVDGSIKIWNLNDVICVRSLNVSTSIIDVFWCNKRILVVDKYAINEFIDNNDYKQQINQGDVWQRYHSGEIVCVSMKAETAIVTACSHGDFIFWQYYTGNPYMRFNIKNPQQRMQIVYHRNFMKTSDDDEIELLLPKGAAYENDCDNDVEGLNFLCMISLNNRPLNVTNGTLLVSLSNGRIQVWSHHHHSQSYITDFNAIHMTGDVITAMTTDTENCFLFTGSSYGYIKIWMIFNFCHSTLVEEEISFVRLRARFPFLYRDDFEGRAKRTVKDQPQPILVNSFLAHKGALISGLIYSEKNQILISSSADKSVRLWDLSGKYINTLGGHVNWQMLSPNEPLPPDFVYKIPADLKNVISYTTLKVLEGGNIPTLVSHDAEEMLREADKNDNEKEMVIQKEGEKIDIDENDADAQLLEKIFSRPAVKPKDEQERKTLYEKPSLDISLSHIPIYRHLRIHRTVPINLPPSIPNCLNINDLPDLHNISQLEPEEPK